MKKIVRAFFVALVIMIAAASVVLAKGVKGFEPYKVPVDKDNLPEEVSEADLDGDCISAHRLEEIAKEKGGDVVIEGTDGNTYTAKPNMLTHIPTSSLVAVNKEEEKAEGEKAPEEPIKNEENDSLVAVNKEEKAEGEKEPDEKPEEPSMDEEDSYTPPETGMGTTPDSGESENEEAPPAPHTHSYEWWYEEVNGLTHTNYYKCSCGDYYSESWNETPKEKEDGGSANSNNSGGEDAGKKEGGNDAPPPKNDPPKNDPPAHEHAWEEVRTVVHHDAVTEKVWVVDKAAWDEQVLVKEAWDETKTTFTYEEEYYYLTGGGLEFPNKEALQNWVFSLSDEELETTPTNYSTMSRYIPVETAEIIHHDAEYKTVHHDEEGHWEEKVVTAAYDEEKVTGYKCSCGATK